MPVIVEFVRKHPTEVCQELGPFRVIEVISDAGNMRMGAFDGFQPFILATCTRAGKWLVNGIDGLEFDYFIVLPPREEAREELETLAEEEDDE